MVSNAEPLPPLHSVVVIGTGHVGLLRCPHLAGAGLELIAATTPVDNVCYLNPGW